ncbi:MAG: 5'-methylthioadenosine/adenosylhomocysteine nucleosidase [Pelistega sp.]|nr:5'-methylthioadenosine/adenosylhomocysteine nucleosidase [Pelistega sp.]
MRIGIMAALQQEIADLLALMGPQMHVTRIGQRDYYEGRIGEHDCVVVLARIGKVAASATCVTLIREFKVEQIVFTGLAGGLGPEVKIGDVVVASELMQHDFNASPIFPRYEIPLLGRAHFVADEALCQQLMSAARDYLQQVDGFAKDVSTEVIAQFGLNTERDVAHEVEADVGRDVDAGQGKLARTEKTTESELSTELNSNNATKASEVARDKKDEVHTIHIHQGMILSGDQFINTHNEANRLHVEHPHALCTEMEGAAIAQICYEYDVPFAVMRVISDKANDDASVDFDSFLNHVARYMSSGILMRWLGV